jgi:hypothetical protein
MILSKKGKNKTVSSIQPDFVSEDQETGSSSLIPPKSSKL